MSLVLGAALVCSAEACHFGQMPQMHKPMAHKPMMHKHHRGHHHGKMHRHHAGMPVAKPESAQMPMRKHKMSFGPQGHRHMVPQRPVQK